MCLAGTLGSSLFQVLLHSYPKSCCTSPPENQSQMPAEFWPPTVSHSKRRWSILPQRCWELHPPCPWRLRAWTCSSAGEEDGTGRLVGGAGDSAQQRERWILKLLESWSWKHWEKLQTVKEGGMVQNH